MGTSFGEKFEEAIAERRLKDPQFGVRTIARKLAKDDPRQTEIIRRRLNKYRPRPGGGAAEVKPTDPTRHEIEKAMGLKRDALKSDADAVAASADEMIAVLMPSASLRQLVREELALVRA